MDTQKEGLEGTGLAPIADVFLKELNQSDIDESELAYYLHDGKENYEREGMVFKNQIKYIIFVKIFSYLEFWICRDCMLMILLLSLNTAFMIWIELRDLK